MNIFALEYAVLGIFATGFRTQFSKSHHDLDTKITFIGNK